MTDVDHWVMGDKIRNAYLNAWHLREDCTEDDGAVPSGTRCIFCVASPDTLEHRRHAVDAAQRAVVAYYKAVGVL